MTLNLFIALFVATAYAQTPTPQEYLMLNAAPAVMIDIARCESGTRQFYDDGSLVRDGVTGTHVGLFQISEGWIKTAKTFDDDIYMPRGNVDFALRLYKKYGTQPWNASKFCWGGTSPPSTSK